MKPQPFCCDIMSGTKEEQNEFKSLFEKVSNDEWTFAFEYYGFSKLYGWDGLTNSNDLVAIKYFTNILPLSEGIAILKQMVGEEENIDAEAQMICLDYLISFASEAEKITSDFIIDRDILNISDERLSKSMSKICSMLREKRNSLQPKPNP